MTKEARSRCETGLDLTIVFSQKLSTENYNTAKQKGIDLNAAADNVFLIDVLQPGMESVEFTEDGYIVSFALGISLVFKKKKFYNPLYSGV